MPHASPVLSSLRQLDTAELIEALRRARQAAGRREMQLRRGTVHHASLVAFRGEIDELAGLITGDRDLFHGKNTTEPKLEGWQGSAGSCPCGGWLEAMGASQ